MKKTYLFAIFPLSFFVLAIPVFSRAQALVQVADSIPVESLFLKIVNWGLLIIAILGIVTMPIVGMRWYKKNRENHTPLQFFRSGSFTLRILITITVFILWYFKVIDKVVNSI